MWGQILNCKKFKIQDLTLAEPWLQMLAVRAMGADMIRALQSE
jgi:hypothetical protein